MRWIALAVTVAVLGCTASKTETPFPEAGVHDTGQMLQDATSGEAAVATPDAPSSMLDVVEDGAPSDDARMDAPADLSLDRTPDAPADGEEGEGGPVMDGAVASDATVDVNDAAVDVNDAAVPPDSNDCIEAGASRKLRGSSSNLHKTPPPGFALPAGGEQIDCTPTKPCPPGLMCIGDGCDDIWQCYAHAPERGEHPCPKYSEPYCGCDGVTFMAISSCPDRPYERIGACEDGVSCDPTRLVCRGPEPPCPEGQVPSVTVGRYGACVPFNYCQCEFVWECPHREKYKCDVTTRRCAALPTDP